jgi:hypothetical protein
MQCLGTGYGNSIYSTIANIPKEKRAVLYATLNAFTIPARNAQEAHDKNLGGGRRTSLSPTHSPTVAARILRNFDKAEAMFKAGKLTVKNTMSFHINMTGEKPVITATCIAQEFAVA